mmetsp:Transcript_36435/g.112182  ORF Transcript_36435/g.112182 Transcript_36435/m.112182 type:complete len:385 (-) Transcript_36435:203-1357(-)
MARCGSAVVALVLAAALVSPVFGFAPAKSHKVEEQALEQQEVELTEEQKAEAAAAAEEAAAAAEKKRQESQAAARKLLAEAEREAAKLGSAGASDVAVRQQLRRAIKEGEAAELQPQELEASRLALVKAASASAREALGRAVKSGGLAELQAGVMEGTTKANEAERLMASLTGTAAATASASLFKPSELGEAKRLLAELERKESYKNAARAKLAQAAQTKRLASLQSALANAEKAGVPVAELQSVKAQVAEEEAQEDALKSIKYALRHGDVAKLEAQLHQSAASNIPDRKLAGFWRKLAALKEKQQQPQQPQRQWSAKDVAPAAAAVAGAAVASTLVPVRVLRLAVGSFKAVAGAACTARVGASEAGAGAGGSPEGTSHQVVEV